MTVPEPGVPVGAKITAVEPPAPVVVANVTFGTVHVVLNDGISMVVNGAVGGPPPHLLQVIIVLVM